MPVTPSFNDKLRQVALLLIIVFVCILVFKELTYVLPGLLGALTVYMLCRGQYFQMIYERKWKKGRAAMVFIIFFLLLLGLPIFIAVTLVSPKINTLLSDPTALIEKGKMALNTVQDRFGISLLSENTLSTIGEKVSSYVPKILNSTLNVITNLAVLLFILYYMLYNGRSIEKTVARLIPLKPENINMLASETKRMVKANALGIPLISIIQGLVATIGYAIFGVEDWGLWGFLTGVFAFFPVVGTMVIWVPLVIYSYATDSTLMATGLLIYSLLVTGNVDYIARMTLLKRMGDVHPVLTILGVFVGLGLFGFIGLIFGPLLISYILVLVKIYISEFVMDARELEQETVDDSDEVKNDDTIPDPA